MTILLIRETDNTKLAFLLVTLDTQCRNKNSKGRLDPKDAAGRTTQRESRRRKYLWIFKLISFRKDEFTRSFDASAFIRNDLQDTAIEKRLLVCRRE